MKQNSKLEITLLVLAIVGMIAKLASEDPAFKQFGGLALYGLTSIAAISKAYRFRHLPATKGQKMTIGAGILLMIASVVGEAIDPNKLYNALWLLGIIATGTTVSNQFRAHKSTTQ